MRNTGNTIIVIAILLCILSARDMAAQRVVVQTVMSGDTVSGDTEAMIRRMERRSYRSAEHAWQEVGNLLASLHRTGFLTASTDSFTFSGDTLRVWLFAGARFSGATVLLRDSGATDGMSGNIQTLYSGAPELPGNVLSLLAGDLNRSGFALARVALEGMEVRDDTLFTTAVVFRGIRYVWDTLEIRGDLRIDNRVMQRILRIRQGRYYDNVALAGMDEYLMLYPFMTRRAPYSLILTDDGRARVVLHLDKARASSFNGIIGFGPGPVGPAGEQKLIFSGDVSLNLMNALERAEEMSMAWTGIRGDQQLTLLYRQPSLSFLPFGIMARFRLFRKGENYYTLNQRGGVVVSTGPGSLFTTWLQRTTSTVLDRSIYTQAVTLPLMTDYETSLFGIEYRSHRLDMPANPGSGYRVAGEVAAGRKKLIMASDIPVALFEGVTVAGRHAEAMLSAEIFFPATKRWIIRPALQTAVVYGSQNQENSLALIGGINTIRGFDEQSIAASSYAAGSLEVRYRFEQSAHFKLFFDMAWYEKRLPGSLLSDTPFGFGAGLSLPSPAGILQVSYAWGAQLGNPLDLRSGRLHFGLDARF